MRHEEVIRPMLFATRSMIEAYAAAHAIHWRDDRSNSTEKYSRNLIRHQVVPVLKQINPGLEETFRSTLERLQGAWDMTLTGIDSFRQRTVQHDGERVQINAELLNQEPSPGWLLWEIIKDQGFTFQQCKLAAGARHSGKVYYSGTHQLTYDRGHFLLTPLAGRVHPFETTVAEGAHEVQHLGHTLQLESKDAPGFTLSRDLNVAQVDADSIQFPLTWRSWREGDLFVPLGMTHTKKVSDFLIDSKVPLPDKQHITVVTSGEQIVWLPGLRIADPFKVTDKTRRILVMTHTSTH
ncbi:MAG: tRNA lysidine(34) synthetase TilS [Bacteroidia bacterium]|nr:tRNA lysidine(34) synthetase TilS [Bacteroidia bacterium]